MKKIVILGGGFGGIEVGRLLGNNPLCEVTVLSERDYFEYYPGLYHIAHGEKLFFSRVPLSYIFPQRVQLYKKTVSQILPKEKTVKTSDGLSYTYDYLVVALGSEPNYFNTPGVNAQSVFSVKDYSYAENLKNHIEELVSKNVDINESKKHIVVIGGGPTGVELASDLSRFITHECSGVESCKIGLHIHLVDASPRVLKVFPEKASTLVQKRLEKLGVQVHLNEKVLEKKDNELVLASGSIKTDTCIWSGGTKVVGVIDQIEGFLYTPQKKIEVDEYMRAKNTEDVFIIGDNAATQYSGLAQTAIADGYYVANTLRDILNNKPLKSYKQKQNAYVVPVGAPWGVLVIKNKVFTGLIPFIGRYVIDTLHFMRILPLVKFIQLPFKNFK